MRFVRPVIGLALLGGIGFWIGTSPELYALVHSRPLPELAAAPNLENGKTVFHAGGCSSCHVPKDQDDKTRLGGGFALHAPPFGTFYTPNISPHPRDGIGSWTVEAFARAMVQGVAPDGSHYYPSFPYTSYQRMSAADLRDLFAYIKTLPPVEGKARGHDLPFPVNIRRSVGGWKLLFLDGQPFRPDPSKPASWNRGAYLVEAMGHCAECHSPRNLLGVIVADKRFAGGPDPEGGGGYIPNITPHENGIKGWTKDDIVGALDLGFTPTGDVLGSTMAAVVRNTSQLPQADREAIAEYLLSLPPRAGDRAKKKR
jgi:mono/diheme cytochrome c family protein